MTFPRAHRDFFGSLDPASQTRLTRLGRIRPYPVGVVIYSQNDPSTHVRVLLAGSVKMTVHSGGRETLLEIRSAGDLLGEREVLKGPGFTAKAAHGATATALRGTRALVISGGDFTRFMESEPSAWAAMARDLEARLSDAESRLGGITSQAANRRLARALLSLSLSTDLSGVGRTSLQLSQAELASWIGVSRETVERVLRDWRGRGIVDTGYRYITVLGLEDLMRIAGMRGASRPRLPAPARSLAPSGVRTARFPGGA
jgi:CRP-like cAMP-binding protein